MLLPLEADLLLQCSNSQQQEQLTGLTVFLKLGTAYRV